MKVLIVEDEHKIAQAIKKGLEQEAYVVDLAYDGETGFDLASTEEYEVIILDLMLPKMNGLTFCRKLRQEEKIHTPILILTARGQVDDRVKGLDAGADDYLSKPFVFEELLARIRALARRPKETVMEVLKYQDLKLDPVKFEVSRAGQNINLSRREFALLRYLLKNQKKILTKDQIISHVWDYEADILPNTVEVYIGNLRKKVDQPFPKRKSLIQTVRGFGYKLVGSD
ncbi:response regulator transcription factor [Patescibacteria group bacterium]